MQEIETKILEVDKEKIRKILESLGAKEVQNTRLTVDWYSPEGVGKKKHDWYLRIRTGGNGKSETTLKSAPKITGNIKQVEEITVQVDDPTSMGKIFEKIGLVCSAHQEKDRVSWLYKGWRFDLDQYPGMPAYLEIEGESQAHIEEAIKLLNLEKYKSVSEGERVLIENEYKLNWSDMRF